MSLAMLSGVEVGAYLSTTLPSRSTRNCSDQASTQSSQQSARGHDRWRLLQDGGRCRMAEIEQAKNKQPALRSLATGVAAVWLPW